MLPWLRRSGWAYIAVAIALALAAWRLSAGGSDTQGDATAAGAAAVATAPQAVRTAPADRVVVHVAGEVRRPGVYTLAADARVQKAVSRAGGATARADLSALNLAATMQDGQQVVVPRRAPVAAGGAGPAEGAAPPGVPGATGSVRLSSATVEQLETLDGIGPTLAARIVEWRQAHGGFASLDQLIEVEGIGPARLESLRAQLVP